MFQFIFYTITLRLLYNQHLYTQNYQLKLQQVTHYKTLVEEARKLDHKVDGGPVVEKETVEEALKEKLELAKQQTRQLAGKEIN